MFSSSFTMSEQEHRQWTPYKHDAPAHSGRFAVARPCILTNSDFSVTDRSRPWSSKTVRQHDLVVTLDLQSPARTVAWAIESPHRARMGCGEGEKLCLRATCVLSLGGQEIG
jgi:hypothetical protein